MFAPTRKSKNPNMNIPKHTQSVHDIGLPHDEFNKIYDIKTYLLTFQKG
jgi:hypothetical protein